MRVTGTLQNLGVGQLLESRPLQIRCRGITSDSSFCHEDFNAVLTDGTGPDAFETTFRAPMGESLQLELVVADEPVAGARFLVPEKILGTHRWVWDCYRARSGTALVQSPYPIGCGGWVENRVDKWQLERPLRVWATGRPEYLAVFEAQMQRFAPTARLQYEYVEDRDDADIKAYLGFPASDADELGLEACAELYACVLAYTDQSTGEAESVTIAAWHLDWASEPDQLVRAVAHELIHALFVVGHRPTPDFNMGKYVSPGDWEMLRLNSHPLIRAGMTMSQVREYLVLGDELLDPPTPTVYEMLWKSAVGFQAAGSARMELDMDWTGTCGFPARSAALYSVAEYGHDGAGISHFVVDGIEIWNSSWRYWAIADLQQRGLPYWEFEGEFGWTDDLIDPISLLHAAVSTTGADAFQVLTLRDGRLEFSAPELGVPDDWRPIRDAVFLVDPAGLQLRSFSMIRPMSATCNLNVEATAIEYGGALQLPDGLKDFD